MKRYTQVIIWIFMLFLFGIVFCMWFWFHEQINKSITKQECIKLFETLK